MGKSAREQLWLRAIAVVRLDALDHRLVEPVCGVTLTFKTELIRGSELIPMIG